MGYSVRYLKKCSLFNSKPLVVACFDCVLIDYFYELKLSIVFDKKVEVPYIFYANLGLVWITATRIISG